MNKWLMFLWDIIKKGIFDDDITTSLQDEIRAYLFPETKEGNYSEQINKVLKAQSSYRLGKYSLNSFGETWSIIKPISSKIIQLEALKQSIQDTLSKAGCNRTVDFLKNPLRLIMYYKTPKTVTFESLKGLMVEEYFYPFILQNNKLAGINPRDEKFPHVLISGVTGSGKTVLMKSFLLSMGINSEGRFYFCNPKADNFDDYKELPQIKKGGYYTNKIDIAFAIESIWLETQNRLNNNKREKIFLLVDELSLLHDKQKDQLKEIAMIGRSLNVFLVLATQRPTKETISTELKSQMTYTLTGRVNTKMEAYYVTGVSNSGCENLQGSGLFVLNASGYVNEMVQAIYPENEKELIRQLCAKFPYESPSRTVEENLEWFDNLEKSIEQIDRFLEAPTVIRNRKEWIETLEEEDTKTQRDLQDSHKVFYEKSLNSATAKKIIEWLKEN